MTVIRGGIDGVGIGTRILCIDLNALKGANLARNYGKTQFGVLRIRGNQSKKFILGIDLYVGGNDRTGKGTR
ncbi:MAG: hypothetical protein LBQ48_05630 [Oscillospiraceae bacterium]|nr:hypothetical protein [Oscillospiraceae bacterium]